MVAMRFRGQEFGGVPRGYWRQRNAQLDPEKDYVEIYRNLAQYEFPWETLQALSLALFRTFAVPSIGELLDRTEEFHNHTQKRYDDTSLLLEQPTTHGFASAEAKTAIRRINHMHRAYNISNDDLRYVLSTFVVVPVRWIEQYGKRELDSGELHAIVRYYREFGSRMGIKDMPVDYPAFSILMDEYEATHFVQTPPSHRVAESTLDLMVTFYPKPLASLVHLAARSVMDPPLSAALGYRQPNSLALRTVDVSLRLRGLALRLFPARQTPALAENYGRMRSYPGGFALQDLGTFPKTKTHR